MSIKNYKSFNKNQNIEVGPITIFVGPNSAGKSSILKLLGLFHQNYHSLNFRKVQYNGEIVDLKDFESITTNNNKKDVEINFKTDICWYDADDVGDVLRKSSKNKCNLNYKISDSNISCSYNKIGNKPKELTQLTKLNLTNKMIDNIIASIKQHKTNYINTIQLLYSCDNIKAKNMYIEFIKTTLLDFNLSFYGIKLTHDNFSEKEDSHDYEAFIPPQIEKLFIPRNNKILKIIPDKNDREYLSKILGKYDMNFPVRSDEFSGIFESLQFDENSQDIAPIDNSLASNKNETERFFQTQTQLFDQKENIFSNIQKISNSYTDEFYHYFLKEIIWRNLLNLLFTQAKIKFDEMAKYVDKIVSPTVHSLFDSISYLPPVRPIPKRFYKKFEIVKMLYGNSFNRMDSVEYIESYNIEERFKIINNYFEKIKINKELVLKTINNESIPELFTIEIKDKSTGMIDNLVDVGHGFSQIIPILFVLTRTFYNEPQTLIFEQPELHLHPKLQSELADIFIASGFLDYPETSFNSIFIETHSEYLIRKLLVYVAKGKMDPEDLCINYVGKYKNGNSYVKRMSIDNQGFFKDKWPEGFFDNSLKLTEELCTARKNKEN